jgi:hypothetical protein
MKFLKFNKKLDGRQVKDDDAKEPKDADAKDQEETKNVDEEDDGKPGRIPWKSDSPNDVVTGDGIPWADGAYYCEPGHGIALVDVLRRVASGVREIAGLEKQAAPLQDGPAPASAELNWDEAFAVIEKTFRKNKVRLVTFQDRSEAGSIPYYLKNMKEGILFYISPRAHVEASLAEAVRALRAAGFVALRRESGILIMAGAPVSDGHAPEEIARFSRGTHLKTKDKRDGTWHVVEINGAVLQYRFDSTSKTLTVKSLKGDTGLIDTETSFVITHSNARQLSKVLKYQASRYTKMFDPATYGLHAEGAPFRLKKHVLIYCGGGKTLVISPDDQAFLVTSKGEYSLTKPEGRVALSSDLTFRKVSDTKNVKFIFGDVWVKFGHLLQKRGLLV